MLTVIEHKWGFMQTVTTSKKRLELEIELKSKGVREIKQKLLCNG